MNVKELSESLQREAKDRSYFLRLEVVEQTASLLKVRLLITRGLFVQVYRNDRFDTTNLALIHNGRRIYARDQLAGLWHRHPVEAPDHHETTTEGRRYVELSEFLDEVEDVLAAKDLP